MFFHRGRVPAPFPWGGWVFVLGPPLNIGIGLLWASLLGRFGYPYGAALGTPVGPLWASVLGRFGCPCWAALCIPVEPLWVSLLNRGGCRRPSSVVRHLSSIILHHSFFPCQHTPLACSCTNSHCDWRMRCNRFHHVCSCHLKLCWPACCSCFLLVSCTTFPSAPTAQPPHSHRTATAQPLHSHCTATAQPPRASGTAARAPHSHRTATAQPTRVCGTADRPPHSHRTATAQPLHSHRAPLAQPRGHRTATAQPLHSHCTATAQPLHSHGKLQNVLPRQKQMKFPLTRTLRHRENKTYTPWCRVDHPQASHAHVICVNFISHGQMLHGHLDVRAKSRHTRGKQAIQNVVTLRLSFLRGHAWRCVELKPRPNCQAIFRQPPEVICTHPSVGKPLFNQFSHEGRANYAD